VVHILLHNIFIAYRILAFMSKLLKMQDRQFLDKDTPVNLATLVHMGSELISVRGLRATPETEARNKAIKMADNRGVDYVLLGQNGLQTQGDDLAKYTYIASFYSHR
jgi:hypothetical protein